MILRIFGLCFKTCKTFFSCFLHNQLLNKCDASNVCKIKSFLSKLNNWWGNFFTPKHLQQFNQIISNFGIFTCYLPKKIIWFAFILKKSKKSIYSSFFFYFVFLTFYQSYLHWNSHLPIEYVVNAYEFEFLGILLW